MSRIDFSTARLARDSVTGEVSFDAAALAHYAEAAGLSLDTGAEENVGAVLSHWYRAHRATGGGPDPIFEQLLAEIEAEDRFSVARVAAGAGGPQ